MYVWFVWRRLNVGCLKKQNYWNYHHHHHHLGTKEIALSIQFSSVWFGSIWLSSARTKRPTRFCILPTRAQMLWISVCLSVLWLNVWIVAVWSLMCFFHVLFHFIFPPFLPYPSIYLSLALIRIHFTHVIHFDRLCAVQCSLSLS